MCMFIYNTQNEIGNLNAIMKNFHLILGNTILFLSNVFRIECILLI